MKKDKEILDKAFRHDANEPREIHDEPHLQQTEIVLDLEQFVKGNYCIRVPIEEIEGLDREKLSEAEFQAELVKGIQESLREQHEAQSRKHVEGMTKTGKTKEETSNGGEEDPPKKLQAAAGVLHDAIDSNMVDDEDDTIAAPALKKTETAQRMDGEGDQLGKNNKRDVPSKQKPEL